MRLEGDVGGSWSDGLDGNGLITFSMKSFGEKMESSGSGLWRKPEAGTLGKGSGLGGGTEEQGTRNEGTLAKRSTASGLERLVALFPWSSVGEEMPPKEANAVDPGKSSSLGRASNGAPSS